MALPNLPVQGQNLWFTPRNDWDLAVKSELEGRLSLDSQTSFQGNFSGLSVKSYGAVGDGVADDTASIKAAIQAAHSGTVKRVIFPSGRYRISEEILIPSRMEVVGYGLTTVIDAAGLPPGAAAFRIGGASENNGSILSGFNLQGNPAKNSDGVYIGNRSGTVAVSDMAMRDIRIESFNVGIPGRYSWDMEMSNIRVHACNRPIEWGPQVNSVKFNGAFSSFSAAAVLSVCETIHFDTLDVVNYTGGFHAFNLFQSQVVFTSPYIEFLARFAAVGSVTEATPSSIIINGGRVTGNISVVNNVGVEVNLPWVVNRGVESDTRRITVSNTSSLSASLNRIKIDRDQLAPAGYRTTTRWRGTTAFPYGPASTGSISSVAGDGYYTVTSPTATDGFLVSSGLILGSQYVLSYRIRKSGGGVAIKNGSQVSAPLKVVESPALDFETFHVPFLATETSLRILWNGAADVQYVSLTEDLVFRDIND